MAYQVIARKYRPQRFGDVVGQEHVTQTLSHAIERKRIAHAYLFCGPRGTGKTTIARIFAKCLNATDGPRVDFKDADPRCQEIAEGRSLDVLEIDAASNRGIDEIRGLRETVRYAPASSRFKIYIIDEVHMLTKEAFNALLKTLEEPPEHVKFMFATTEPEKVLPTILSRCQRFDLRRIPAALIVKHLEHIAAQEHVKIEPAALYAIARGAEGAMRDAESTLDQLISFCGESIEEADVLSMFGLTSQTQVLQLARAILEGNVQGTLAELNSLASQGKDLGRLLTDLLGHFRNLLIYQISSGDLSLLEVAEAEATALAEQAKLATVDGKTRILEILGDAEMRLRDAVSKKILLEVALLNAIEARKAVSIDSVLKQLENLRDSGGPGPEPVQLAESPEAAAPPPASRPTLKAPATSAAYPPPAQPNEPSTATAPATPQFADAPASDPGDLDALWAQLLEGVGRASPFTRTYLLEAHPVSLTKNLFTIGFPPEHEDHIGLVDNAKNATLIQTRLAEIGYPGLQVKFIKSNAPARRAQEPLPAPLVAPRPAAASPAAPAKPAPKAEPAARPKPAVLDKNEFKNDPLIQRALEAFKGQIVDVRTSN